MIEVAEMRGVLAAGGLPVVGLAMTGWRFRSTWFGSQALHLAIPLLLPLLFLAALAPDWRLRTILLLGALAILLLWRFIRWQMICALAPIAIASTVVSPIRCSAYLRGEPGGECSGRMSPDRIPPMHPLTAPIIVLVLLLIGALALASEVAASTFLAAPAPAPAPAVAVAVAAGDVLQPGDLLHITVYENPDLTVDVRVPGEGMVQFPLIGRIAILPGTSSGAFAHLLQKQLEANYLNRALVTVTVKEYGVRRFYVMGGVARPGAFPLNPAMSATAMRAISEAGGLLDDADRRNIRVMREDGRGASTALQVQVDGEQTADVALLPNDMILVSRLERIYITGQVKLPGSVPSNQANLTVVRALSAAGGFAAYARMSQVQLLRTGQPVRTVDVVAILAGDAVDPVLLPGDMLHVPERRF